MNQEKSDQPDPPIDPPDRQALNYFPPQEDQELRAQRMKQRLAGAAFSCLIVFASVFVFSLSTLKLGRGGPLPLQQNLIAMLAPVVAIGILVGASAYQHFVRKRRWVVQGVLIGIGIGALIEGACFAFFESSK